MKVVLLAAGFSTRLYPLTKDFPKGLLPIGEKPMLSYLLEKIEEIGRYEKEVAEVYLISNERVYPAFLKYVQEIEKEQSFPFLSLHILSNGVKKVEDRKGALRDLEKVLDYYQIEEDFLVLASDNFFEASILEIYQDFKQGKSHVICGQWDEKSKDSYMQQFALASLDSKGGVLRLEEKPKEIFSRFMVFAIYFYKKEAIAFLKDYVKQKDALCDSPGIFPAYLLSQGQMFQAHILKGKCYDIGTLEKYEEVKSLYL